MFDGYFFETVWIVSPFWVTVRIVSGELGAISVCFVSALTNARTESPTPGERLEERTLHAEDFELVATTLRRAIVSRREITLT